MEQSRRVAGPCVVLLHLPRRQESICGALCGFEVMVWVTWLCMQEQEAVPGHLGLQICESNR